MPRVLTGHWIIRDGMVVADSVCLEIEALIAHHLNEVSRDPSGWVILYRDRHDGQLWELSYPQSHMEGGGPPQLATITAADAGRRYGPPVA